MPDIFDLIDIEDTTSAPAPSAGSQDSGDIFDMVANEQATAETEDNNSIWSAAKRGARKVLPSFASSAASTAEAFLRSFGTTDPREDLNEYIQNIDRLRPGYSQTPEGKRHIEEVKKSIASWEPTAIEKTFDKLADITGDSARHWDKQRSAIDAEKPKDLQRKLWGNLDLLKDPRWWTETGIDTASSLIPTVVAYAVGGPVAAGATGGSQEGSSLYRELVDEGVPEESARKASTAYGVVSGVLNSFGAEAVLGKRGIEKLAGRGIFKAMARRAVGGAGEAVTEYLEEPAQAAAAALAKDKPMQEVVSDVVESLKNIDVIPTSFVLGAATNAMAPESKAEQTEPEVAEEAAGQQPIFDESRMLPQPAVEVTPDGTAFTPEQKSSIINQGLNVPGMTDDQVTASQQSINTPPQPNPNRASNMAVIAERGLMVLPQAEPVYAEPVQPADPAQTIYAEGGPVTDPGRMLVNPHGIQAPAAQVSPEGAAMMPEQKSDLINRALDGMPDSEIQKAQDRMNAPERLDALTELRDKIAGNLLKKDGTPKKSAGARALARLYTLNEQIVSLTPTTTPEAPASMEAQMRALVDGRKPAVLVTPGESMPEVPDGFKTAQIPEGTLIFSQEGTLNLARSGKLGSALGYGIDSKPKDSQTVVTARDKNGTVVQDVVTDGSQGVMDAAKKAAGEDGTVEVRPAAEAIAEREEGQQHGLSELSQERQQEQTQVSDLRNEQEGDQSAGTPALHGEGETQADLDSVLDSFADEREVLSAGGVVAEEDALLYRALGAAVTPGWSFDEAIEAVKYGLANGRRDIAEAIVARAKRIAETLGTTPGVPEGHHKYQAIKEDLAKRKVEAQRQAEQLQRLFDLNDNAPSSKAGSAASFANQGETQTPADPRFDNLDEHQRNHISGLVEKLGSVEAVAQKFNTDSTVHRFARHTAQQMFTDSKDAGRSPDSGEMVDAPDLPSIQHLTDEQVSSNTNKRTLYRADKQQAIEAIGEGRKLYRAMFTVDKDRHADNLEANPNNPHRAQNGADVRALWFTTELDDAQRIAEHKGAKGGDVEIAELDPADLPDTVYLQNADDAGYLDRLWLGVPEGIAKDKMKFRSLTELEDGDTVQKQEDVDESSSQKGQNSAPDDAAGQTGTGGAGDQQEGTGTDAWKRSVQESSEPGSEGSGAEVQAGSGDSAASGLAPLHIAPLSDKAFLVKGDTKPHKNRLNKNGLKGWWNLKHRGWVFPKTREAEVREALKDLLEAPKSAKELVSEAESMAKQYAAEGKTKDQFVDDAPGRLRWIFENSKGQTVQIGTPIREAFADAGYKRPGNIGEVWDRANGHEKAGTANEPDRQSPLKEWADKISANDPAGWVRRYVAEHGTDPAEQAVADKFDMQSGRASKIIEVNGINGLKQLAEVGKPGALEEFSRVFKEKKPAWAKPKMATSVFMGRVTDILERSARLQENARNSDRENFAIAYRKAYGDAVTAVLNEALKEGVDVTEAHAFASNMAGAQLRQYSDGYFERAGGKGSPPQISESAKPAQPKGVPASDSTLDAELADMDMDDLEAMFDEVANEQPTVKESLTADEPAGMTLLEARNMLIELRTQAESQGRVSDDRLLSRIWQAEQLIKELEAEEAGAGSKPVTPKKRTAPKTTKTPKALQKAKDTQTAKKIAAEAAKHGVKGVGEAMRGLVDLFGGADSLSSFPSGLDRDTYAKAKPHFQKALEEFRAAGKGVKDFMRFIVQNFSAKVKPYLMHFLDEVKNGDMLSSDEVHAGKDNIDDRIEETGAAESGESVRDDREGTAGKGDNPSPRVVPETTQGTDEIETASAADAESSRESAQADQSTDGSRVSTPRSRRGGSPRVHSDQTGGRSAREDRGRRDLEPQQTPASNYRIPGDFTPGRGEAAKYADNLAAIRILKTLQKEKRLATAEEQQALARYVGWGGLANAFRRPDGSMAKGWEARVEELEGMLTEKELEVARNSTQFAHYTSKDVVDGLWKIAQRLGFKGGNVLEPAMGTGNFLGLVPEELAGATHFTGVEYDPLTAGIAAALYPQSNVIHSGFEKIPLPPNYFDFVIGNPPFSQNSLRFKYTPDFNRFSMHNQFMLAGLESLKPGGVQAFVVSRYFLDAKSKEARARIADQADLVAAFRLPDTAFKANAGTEVVTDIIVLQKIADPESRNDVQWVGTDEVADPLGGDPITVNEYFKKHPQNIIGTLDRSGSQNMHNDVNVHLEPGTSLSEELDTRIQSLPKNILAAETPQDRTRQAFKDLQTSIEVALRGGEIGNVMFNVNGELIQVYEKEAPGGGELFAERVLTEDSPWHNSLQQNEDGKWYEVVDKLDKKGKPVKVLGSNGKPTKLNQKEERVYDNEADIPGTKKLGKLGYARLKGAVQILDTLIEQINLENTQNTAGKQIEANRKKLKRQYQAFVKEHDYMNSSKMLRIVDALPNGALLRSLEAKYKAPITKARAKTLGLKPRGAIVKTADILDKRIVYPYEVPTSADSATDALAVVLSETGGVDLKRIADLTGQTEQRVVDELHTGMESPVIFKDPETGRWETADEYLGGNVVRKLEAAKQAEMDKNIAALEKVQPEPWTADKVTVSLGATWVPEKTYAAFVEHLTGAPAKVLFSRLTNTFSVTGNAATSGAASWNTPGRNVVDLLSNVLNSQAIKVTHTVSDGHGGTHTYVDTEATQAANDMAEALKEEFSEWIFRDSGRRRELVDLFNRKFNVRVTKQRDGSHLKFPGKVPDHIIKLRRHQVNGIWRGIVDRFVLYDHAVGSGKTFTAIARAIERKRMGLSKKPMMVVPNHILEQVAKDVYTLYPGAKVLAAGTKDLSKANRRRLFARIATGDWDLVIVPHSSFQFIGISPDTEERYLQEELSMAIQAVEEAEAEAEAEGYSGRRKPLTVKEAERLRDNIEARLEKVKERASKRDNLLTFEQMGVDDLTVDESHEFKNLFYHSRLNVRGMNPKAGSAKAYDLWLKVRVLRESKNGSVAFMTGTPVSNSAVELYGIMRYLAADALEEMGLEHFDAWRSQFASVSTAFEPKESGRGLKEVNRIGRDWSNMRSLMDLYYSFADTVSNDDIKKWYKEDNDGAEFPIPKVKSGGRRSVNVEPSEVQERIIEDIVSGFDHLPDIEDVDQRNAERLRLMDRARKVSLDARAVDPYIQDNGEGGKLEQVAVEVKRVYDAWQKDKGTQLVFLDRSVPKAKGDAAKIAKYDSLVRQLEQAEEVGDEAKAMKLSDQLEKYDQNEMASLKAAQQGGWNAYDEIKKRLIESGIPENEIRYVQEATTDDQKKLLFEEVNAGKVRVLFGSTPRMGAGTNVQERLVALHHVDVTWKPSDIEQREGRIIRQGNSLFEKYADKFEVEILAYTTNRTVDAKLWSLNATKLKMINGLRHYTGDFNIEFDDSDSVGMAEIAAIASGEPLQLERVQLTSEIDKLNRQKNAHRRRIYGLRDELDDHQRALENENAVEVFAQHAGTQAGIEEKANSRKVSITYDGESVNFGYAQAAEAKGHITRLADAAAENGEKFSINVDGKKYTARTKAHDAVQKVLGDGMAFEAKFEGDTYISRSAMDKAITQKVKAAIEANLDQADPQAEMDETQVGSVRLGELEVDLSAQVVVGGRIGGSEQSVEIFAEAKDGKTWLVNTGCSGALGRGGKNLAEAVRGLSAGISRRIREFPTIVQQLKEKADKAREMIPKLESLVDEPFPKEQELEEKQRRLEEVEQELSAEADAASETDSDPVYSRKTPQQQARLTKQQVLQTIGPILQNWKNAPRIEAVQSVKDLPDHLKNYIFSNDPHEGAGIDGVFDPKTGTIFLIADALPSTARATHVLLHEVVGHYGLRGMLGKDFNSILDQIGNVRRKDLVPIAARWGYDLRTRGGRRGAAEEWLAEIAGRGETNGFLKRAVVVIRDWLRSMGFNMKYSDADIVALVAKARKYVEKGVEQGGSEVRISYSKSAIEALYAKVSELEKKTDAAYESGDYGLAEDLDARLAEEREWLDNYASQYDYDFEQDAVDNEAGIEEQLAGAYKSLLDLRAGKPISNGFVTEEGVIANMRDVVDSYGQQGVRDDISDTELIEAAKDAYQNRRRELSEKPEQSIKFSRAAAATAQTPRASRIDRDKEAIGTRLDYLRMKFQDKFLPLKRTQQALKKRDWQEREDNNPYLTEELYHGIAKDRLDKFEAEQIEPLMEEIKAAPVSLDELEQYLYARHVPERNAYIQKINPEFEEGGSGMTDAEASKIIDGFRKAGKLRVLHNLAQKVWSMAEMQRRIIREEGLEEQERLDAWEQFNFYVPLKGAPDGLDEGHGRSIGRGFAVTKSGTRAALGRRSEAENILAHLAAQVADTIVRAERAKVGKAFLQMVEENPDPSLWTVRTRDNLPTRQVLAKNPAFTALKGKLQRRQAALEKAEDGAEIERLQQEIAEIRTEMEATPPRQVAEVDDFEWIRADNVLPITRDGQVHYIQIENRDLARVMKNLGAADQGKSIRALAWLNRVLAMVNTSLNPEFIITNFERDFQTAMINLSGEESAKIAAKVAKGIPASMRGIRNALRGSNDSDMAKWYARFKAAGGQVGYLDLQNIDQTQRQIQKLVREQDGKLGTVWKYVQKVGKFIGDYNTMVENAVRLSAFKTAIENGMSEAKAASLAKNLTVNFNRKGELGPAANALYLFFNAGVQGSARIITSLAKSKRTRKICAGITLTAFALAEINRLQAGDDDDDENRWDKVSDYTKHTNLLLMRGDESGDAFKVKLPYGYNMFVALGYTMSDVRAYLTSGGKHGKSPAQGAVSLFHAGMNAFNPLGGDDSLLQLISPTIMDPFVQVATNENFMGTPIMPNQPSFGPPKPKSEMYWSSVRPLSMAISKQLNELTGGSSVEPGVVDISPEVLDHFWDFATGGAGRFYADSINAMAAMARGEELSIRRVPFARQVYQEKSDYYDRQNLHNHMDKVTAHYGLFKEMMETGRKGDAMRYRQEHPEIALKRTADHLRRRLTKLRQGKEKLENVDKERYKDRIERIEREIQRLTMAFNRKYNQTVTR